MGPERSTVRVAYIAGAGFSGSTLWGRGFLAAGSIHDAKLTVRRIAHTVGGNPRRPRLGTTEIELDERWKTAGSRALRVGPVLTGPLRYHYRRAARRNGGGMARRMSYSVRASRHVATVSIAAPNITITTRSNQMGTTQLPIDSAKRRPRSARRARSTP